MALEIYVVITTLTGLRQKLDRILLLPHGNTRRKLYI